MVRSVPARQPESVTVQVDSALTRLHRVDRAMKVAIAAMSYREEGALDPDDVMVAVQSVLTDAYQEIFWLFTHCDAALGALPAPTTDDLEALERLPRGATVQVCPSPPSAE